MDKLVVAQKLESLRRCITRIEDKGPADITVLVADPDLQDVIVLNLTRAVQLCVDIASHLIAESQLRTPNTMGECFSRLQEEGILDQHTAGQMRKAVGFRNIAVHNYEEINWQIVQAIYQHGLNDFKQFAKLISAYCQL